MADKQIKSKERVADHGEVYTAEREVNAMLDLVKNETERIDSRFLEPACGNGNFLAEILRRKLEVAKKTSRKNPDEFEKNSVLAVMSIYGVELLEDNVKECRERLYDIWFAEYKGIFKNDVSSECQAAVKYVLEHNILCGNALSMLKVDSNGNDTSDPIIFVQWDCITGNLVKRRDYRLDELMRGHNEQMELQMLIDGWEYDEDVQAWIPSPIKEYDPIDYWEVQHA